jgi:hypothetical protein
MQRQGNCFHYTAVALAAATVELSIAIQGLFPITAHWGSDSVVVPGHWSEIADDESSVVGILGPSQEGDDTPFRVAAIHPLESGWFEIHLIQ